ncbi:restriction endonuclease subunit S [Ruminococcus sp.]|uniref:restriction endonuclease subunit S n=1 Tax=Ruminococcus sp. TaxID=41978 RepID=UPI0025DDCB60|nr:restriction endonuclease subunit S [Ruminococcus sp.]
MRQMKDSGIEWIGEIPENWNTRRIKHLADTSIQNNFIDGDWIESPDIEDEGIRYLTTGNVGDGCYKEQGNGYISLETFQKLNCKYAYPNDYVISRLNAPYGRSCILPDSFPEYVLAVDIVILRTNEDKKYLCYTTQCNGYQRSVEDQAKGTTMKRISRTNLGNIVIPLPSLPEQQAISAHLDRQCAHIDNIIEKTKASIEEYKKLRQAVITQAVTKGVRGDRPMKNSGIEWIGEIPEDWNVYRIAALYEERNEAGNDELPILTVSINTGVSDRELSDEESLRVFVRSEDRSKYMKVYPGDLTYNMMRAWQGAFGAVRVLGMVSPAYVIAKPKQEIDSRYMEALLRTPAAKEEMKRHSYGIADFRMRLYWDYFKIIKVCFPTLSEQKEIADYIDTKCAEIDTLISKKEQFLTELDSYKKSMIYEYVTGKKEVPIA